MKARIREIGWRKASAPALTRRYRRFYQLVFCGALCLGFAAPVQASVRAWGCLLYASNADTALDLPPPLAHYDVPLRRFLGYSNYRVIAQREIAVENQAENLLVSAGALQVLLTSLSSSLDGKYLVGLLFVEGNKQVMETQAKVTQGSPLFIRGPDWRDGQIIIVVMLAPSLRS
ncbi:MAG: hypothetical protein JO066_05725 [Verrucomicrobia bacterium]|nr:hypothetical protein [Verrucomicrobiota bacterium]MBV9130479.1 hypothetical protein [Verrucomicrobiota bacterium]MBV9298458.1 hypothetical protein [Verrucomicrobiota bacterium]MBV9644299.1 hypothetical protein [Verrucomicrobiota bacterium]